jgi:tRNA modification GTPase
MTLDVREETPRGRGAVSVVSVRGAGALERVARLSARACLEPGSPQLVRLVAEAEDLDEALVCVHSPVHVEIHLHGSPILVRALLSALGSAAPGASVAPGTAEARAHALLARAPCESAARILLDQAEGAWRAAIGRLARGDDAARGLELLVAASRRARFALEPARVVLAGPVNAGKSTLFNVLCGERRALTSDAPGTTRDLVRATVPVGRHVIELVDTAGEREPDDADPSARVERAGQERARAEQRRADLVLWLTDAATGASAAPQGALHVWTCADRVARPPSPSLSALTDPRQARATIGSLVRQRLDLPEDPWAPGAALAFDVRSRALLADLVAAARESGERALRERARGALLADGI